MRVKKEKKVFFKNRRVDKGICFLSRQVDKEVCFFSRRVDEIRVDKSIYNKV